MTHDPAQFEIEADCLLEAWEHEQDWSLSKSDRAGLCARIALALETCYIDGATAWAAEQKPPKAAGICRECGKSFLLQRKGQKYCQHKCAGNAGQRRRRAEAQELANAEPWRGVIEKWDWTPNPETTNAETTKPGADAQEKP